jgi:hypothetical protein
MSWTLTPNRNEFKMTSRKKLWVVGLAITSYFVVSVLLGDFPHGVLIRYMQLPFIHAELDNYRGQWLTEGVTHYKMQVENLGFTSYAAICSSAELEVVDDQVINFVGAGEEAQWCPSVYGQLTVTGLFNIASDYIKRNDPWRVIGLQIEYESSYGYIKHLGIHVQPTNLDSLIFGEDYWIVVNPTFFRIKVNMLKVMPPSNDPITNHN